MISGANHDSGVDGDPSPAPNSFKTLLEMRGIRKSFGPTHALRGVDLSVRDGEVHALIGENGAGKSTLMKVLSGALAPDGGTMSLDEDAYAPSGPNDARAVGVSMIYQELNLASHLTVEENIFLGMEKANWGFTRRSSQERAVVEALGTLGRPDIHPRSPVSRLSVAARQIVENARALITRSRLIVLDEPTSSLTAVDTERLFDVIQRMRRKGVSFVYISHFLEEVERIADRFTVLREGSTVGSGDVRGTSLDSIIELMVGRTLKEFFPRVPHERGEPLLELEGLCGEGPPRGIDMSLHRGEILGIAGLVCAGRTETLRAIYGLDPIQSGAVTIHGVRGGYVAPSGRVRQGVGLLSEDRKEEGLALGLSIADNVTLSRFGPVSVGGWVLPRRQRRQVERAICALQVKCRTPLQPVGDLSGGNQQKVALSRLSHQEADIVLLDEPTRGIDVASKIEVYRLMGGMAAEGRGVLFVSSYIPELLGVADRLAVMCRGRLSPVRDIGDWDEKSIMAFATRGQTA